MDFHGADSSGGDAFFHGIILSSSLKIIQHPSFRPRGALFEGISLGLSLELILRRKLIKATSFGKSPQQTLRIIKSSEKKSFDKQQPPSNPWKHSVDGLPATFSRDGPIKKNVTITKRLGRCVYLNRRVNLINDSGCSCRPIPLIQPVR